jgi:GxxExxY protein
MPIQDDPITRVFIGYAMRAHSRVGPGLDEEIYHQELAADLTAAGVPHASKPKRDLVYHGIVADTFVPDLVVQDHLIPELKCLRGSFSGEHLVQLFCYCKLWRIRTGMLVDFGKQSLIWKRYIYDSFAAQLPISEPPNFVRDPALAAHIVATINQCLHEIGLGYRETTWRGLVTAALRSSGLNIASSPQAEVLHHHGISLPCVVVEGTCAIMVTALHDRITTADRAVLQTYLRWLNLDWGIVTHFGKSTADLCFVKKPKA